MARFSSSDRAAITAIRESLRTYVDGGPTGISSVIAPLRDLLGFRLAIGYGVDEVGDRFGLSFAEAEGGCGVAVVRSVLGEFIAAQTKPFAAYDPRRPEPWNRNAVLDFPDLARRGMPSTPVTRVAFPKLGVDVAGQLRVLVCDGPSLLAWVGGFRDEPYTAKDRRVFAALVPALRRRLLLERTLATAATVRAALDVALDQLAGAAFLVAPNGRPLATNALGQAAFDTDPSGTRSRLERAAREKTRESGYQVTPVVSKGAPAAYLLIERNNGTGEARTQAAARAWSLTRRQREVLARAIDGASNARIAAELRISDRTVEAHLAAIMARAQVGSRAALVSAALGHSA